MSVTRPDENLPYHAARLLILIRLAGKPRSNKEQLPAIKGRTLLAKLDFFCRYPAFLLKAAERLGQATSPREAGLASEAEADTVESRMVRFRYGPWDHVYYVTLAYLLGKGLIRTELQDRTELFRLTEEGAAAADALAKDEAFCDIAARAALEYRLFKSFGGTRLKDFIYSEFPEVVNRQLNVEI